jgi:hypothetical protein
MTIKTGRLSRVEIQGEDGQWRDAGMILGHEIPMPTGQEYRDFMSTLRDEGTATVSGSGFLDWELYTRTPYAQQLADVALRRAALDCAAKLRTGATGNVLAALDALMVRR